MSIFRPEALMSSAMPGGAWPSKRITAGSPGFGAISAPAYVFAYFVLIFGSRLLSAS